MIIKPDNEMLSYSGRIDFDDRLAPVLVYACSSIGMKFAGTSLKAVIANHRSCWTNELGYFIDGEQKRFTLSSDEEKKTYTLAEGLSEGTHELLLFKRMDPVILLRSMDLRLMMGLKCCLCRKTKRKMEFFGDSVSCGEVSEAVEYVGKPDPEHDGEYSNSWYSYAWMTARKLNAQIHDTSQGGISLLDDTGWFAAPHYKGVESCYDKIEYHPDLGPTKQWDFSKYVPHVVVVAIGQNDNHPVDYMAEDYDSEKSKNWRKHYQAFIEKLMQLYTEGADHFSNHDPLHDKSWDRSIDEVCTRIGSERVHHFLYTKNGSGTPGHIRIPEAEQMSDELAAYINSLGDAVWES